MTAYIVRIPERIEHIVEIEAASAAEAANLAYESVMNGHPEQEFGDRYTVYSLGTDGANITVTEG